MINWSLTQIGNNQTESCKSKVRILLHDWDITQVTMNIIQPRLYVILKKKNPHSCVLGSTHTTEVKEATWLWLFQYGCTPANQLLCKSGELFITMFSLSLLSYSANGTYSIVTSPERAWLIWTKSTVVTQKWAKPRPSIVSRTDVSIKILSMALRRVVVFI